MTDKKFTRKDYLSDAQPRWCAGCGCHGAFNSVMKTFADLQLKKENVAVISGIGCSSRFPYYSDTYGFHTIHGRAATVAQGVKAARPETSVWVVTGDGDGMSIGGNHFIHMMRRNPEINMLLFNNEIYGLTKGQLSPTSPIGLKTKTSKFGSVENPMRPLPMAIASGATFAARVIDTDGKHLQQVLKAAYEHKGVVIVEILINCVIYADGIWEPMIGKDVRADNSIWLEEGKPMIFGKESNKGIMSKDGMFHVVTIGQNGITEKDLLVHDPHCTDVGRSYALASLHYPDFPVPLGILKCSTNHPAYHEIVAKQKEEVIAQIGEGDFNEMMKAGDSWEITKDGEIKANN